MADKLPEEVITHILGFLRLADRKEACLVNRRWYHASLDPILLKDTFHAPSSASDFISRLGKRKTPHLILDQIDSSLHSKVLIEEACQYLAENLQSFTLKGSNITEGLFLAFISNCHSLVSLDLSYCNSLFMSGQLLSQPDRMQQLKGVLRYVKSLNLSSIRYLSDVILNRFFAVCPNIETLILSGNQITFHSQMFSKRGRIGSASMSVITFSNIVSYIKKKSSQLRSLSLSRTSIDDESLKVLSNIPGLQLRELALTCCRDVTDEGIASLCKAQSGIEDLDLSQCTGLGDSAVAEISLNLMCLKKLNLSKCRQVSDRSIGRLGNLGSMKYLDLSACYTITSAGLNKGLCSPVSLSSLSFLNIHGCSSVKDSFIVELSKSIPNVLHLDLGSCGITDVGLYFICKFLQKLQFLGLAWCKEISDNGILGRPLGVNLQHHLDHEDHGHCKCTRKQFGQDVLNLPKVGNKNKYTELKDAEKMLLEEGDNNVHQISDLYHLRSLDLTACSKITDESIQSLKLPEMKSLNLSLCLNLSDASLLAIAYHLPSLEELNLSHCNKITDTGLKAVSEWCLRLTTLDISKCDLITNKTIEALMQNSRRLKYLDVAMCGSVSLDMVERCESGMPMLHTVQKRLLNGEMY